MVTTAQAVLFSCLLFLLHPSNAFFSSVRNTPNTHSTKEPQKAPTHLLGGYDATIGTDPSTPIQFFVLPNNTCPYAQRTHIALHELQLPFDLIEVSVRPAPDWYLKINPRGKVPSIRVPTSIHNSAIYESAICNEFLCDFSSSSMESNSTSLMPDDPFVRARIRLLNDHCDNVFSKAQFTFFMNRNSSRDDELRVDLEKAITEYENALSMSGGPYLMGNEFTLADVHVVPFFQRLLISLKHWKNYEIPKEKFPNVVKWIDDCLERESVKISSMSKEKTIEVYSRFIGINYGFGGLNKS